MAQNKFLNPPLEYIFVVIASVFGLLLVFANPPFLANDEDRHAYNAYRIANLEILPDRGPDNLGGAYLPKNFLSATEGFMMRSMINRAEIERYYKEVKSQPLNAKEKDFFYKTSWTISPVGYIPAAIGIMAGQLIESSAVWIDYWGRIGGLICYIVLVFFALRLMPFHKNILFLWALAPMVMYQAAAITYDTLNNSLSFLLIAMSLNYAFARKDEITRKEIGWFVLAAIVNVYSKNQTILLPFLFFLIPAERRGGRKMGILLFAVFSIMYFLPPLTWGKIIDSMQLKSFALQRDFYFNGGANLAYNLSNPLLFMKNMFLGLLSFKEFWAHGVIGKFGLSYLDMPNMAYLAYGLFIMIFAFIDGKKEYTLNLKNKLLIGSIAAGTVFIVMSGMLILGSPVGADMIFGLQGRYFVPAVPLFLILLYNNNFIFKIWNKFSWLFVSLFSIAFLIIAVITVNNYFWNL